jgi:hypothetical protein
MHQAKQQVLEQLMSLMDDQMLSRFKKKGAAPEMSPVDAEPKAPEAVEAKPEGEEVDAESLRKLMEIYGQDEEASMPADVNSSY